MEQARYTSFNGWLRRRFGCTVRRLPVDLGRGCPNRTGHPPGCAFCLPGAIRPGWLPSGTSPDEQVALGLVRIASPKVLIYLQEGANTDGDPDELEGWYRRWLGHPRVAGLIVGTRPDTLPPAVVAVLSRLADETFVAVELGLQTGSDTTLRRLNRNHTFADFAGACARLTGTGVIVGAHLILGLPGEDRATMAESIRAVVACGVDAVKMHHLQVLAGTLLEAGWRSGEIDPLAEEEYPGLVADLLEMLPERVAVMRLVNEAPERIVLAPRWRCSKPEMLRRIVAELAGRGTRQGSRAVG